MHLWGEKAQVVLGPNESRYQCICGEKKHRLSLDLTNRDISVIVGEKKHKFSLDLTNRDISVFVGGKSTGCPWT